MKRRNFFILHCYLLLFCLILTKVVEVNSSPKLQPEDSTNAAVLPNSLVSSSSGAPVSSSSSSPSVTAAIQASTRVTMNLKLTLQNMHYLRFTSTPSSTDIFTQSVASVLSDINLTFVNITGMHRSTGTADPKNPSAAVDNHDDGAQVQQDVAGISILFQLNLNLPSERYQDYEDVINRIFTKLNQSVTTNALTAVFAEQASEHNVIDIFSSTQPCCLVLLSSSMSSNTLRKGIVTWHHLLTILFIIIGAIAVFSQYPQNKLSPAQLKLDDVIVKSNLTNMASMSPQELSVVATVTKVHSESEDTVKVKEEKSILLESNSVKFSSKEKERIDTPIKSSLRKTSSGSLNLPILPAIPTSNATFNTVGTLRPSEITLDHLLSRHWTLPSRTLAHPDKTKKSSSLFGGVELLSPQKQLSLRYKSDKKTS